MAFKMKGGSPFQRNFGGSGSPVKQGRLRRKIDKRAREFGERYKDFVEDIIPTAVGAAVLGPASVVPSTIERRKAKGLSKVLSETPPMEPVKGAKALAATVPGGRYYTLAKSPSERNWDKARESFPGIDLAVEKNKTLDKNSNDWKRNQNEINRALGDPKRYELTREATATTQGGATRGRTKEGPYER